MQKYCMRSDVSNNTKVVIRTDASLKIGSGHVMRCLVLANSLKDAGYKIVFSTRAQPGDLNNLIQANGFTVQELPISKSPRTTYSSSGLQSVATSTLETRCK